MKDEPAIAPVAASRCLRQVAVVVYALVVACRPGSSADADGSGPVALESSEVQVIGTSEALANVRDLEVLSDGTVWVLNSVEPFFVGFGPEGDVLAEHGQAGGGPEEFGLPSAFVTGGVEGEAWVFDPRRHVLIEVSDLGVGRSEMALPHASIPPGSVRGGMDVMSNVVRTAALGDEIVLPRSSVSMEDGVHAYRLGLLGADLVALDIGSRDTREIVALGDVLSDPSGGFRPTQGGFPLWYRLWAVCGADAIRVYDRGRNQMRGFSPSGAELEPIPLPPPAFTEATPRQFVLAFFDIVAAETAGAVGVRPTAEDSVRIVNQALQEIDGEPAELAAYLPRYVDFRCSDDATLWLRPFDVEIGRGGLVWLRITANGAVREVRFPDRFDPYRFTSERIWGVQRDALDVASVAWIEDPGPGGA